jgi:hypothetical protein
MSGTTTFDHVGFQDQFHHSVQFLQDFFSLSVSNIPFERTNPNRIDHTVLPSSTLNKIKALTKLDQELYDAAREKFAK